MRYKGEPILGIVATSERAALEALALVRVSYDQLPAVLDVEEALKPGAPSVNATYPKNTFEYYGKYDHQKLRFGETEAGFAQADVVLEDRYQMSPIEHAPTETNGSITVPDTNGRFTVYTSTQALVLLARHLGQDQRHAVEPAAFHRRHRRRRLRRQGRYHDRAALHPRGAAHRRAGALPLQPPRGDAVRLAARRRAHLRQGRRHARRPHRRAAGASLFRQRRLYPAVELRGGEMRGPYSRALHHPQRPRRRVLRLHQPDAGDGDARLRRHRARLRARMPDGQARRRHRHGPARIPHPQRLSRRRHESAPARGEELRADRMRAGHRRKSQLAAARRIPPRLVAVRRRRARASAAPDRSRAPAPRRGAARTRKHAAARHLRTAGRGAPTSPSAPPPPPAALRRHRRRRRSPASTHGAPRFSSVFGTRRR